MVLLLKIYGVALTSTGGIYIARLNATPSTSSEPASPSLPPSGKGLEPEVFHVNVQVVPNHHLQVAFTGFSRYSPYLRCLQENNLTVIRFLAQRNRQGFTAWLCYVLVGWASASPKNLGRSKSMVEIRKSSFSLILETTRQRFCPACHYLCRLPIQIN
jgi:hypothetical protein